ncbi:MAG: flagellar motor switch protein FliN [Spirochaetota bacterium]|nr:flagellar motor switch protein FliN [Spirochaetota bacterium]
MDTYTFDEVSELLSDVTDFSCEDLVPEDSKLTFAGDKNSASGQSPRKAINKSKTLPLSDVLSKRIELLSDIQLDVIVELGKTNIVVKDILQLTEGSILNLNQPADEPFGVFVNQRPIARGEVVVIDESFGIRVLELMPSTERSFH